MDGCSDLIEALPWSPDWMADTDTPLFEDAFAESDSAHGGPLCLLF
jgi:hypothetical protein